jgi:four helix bundle protein
MSLAIDCYRLTGSFPKDARYELTSQMRRAVISIPSNIAEGFHLHSSAAYIYHLRLALGSQAELDTQLELAIRLQYTTSESTAAIAEAVGSRGPDASQAREFPRIARQTRAVSLAGPRVPTIAKAESRARLSEPSAEPRVPPFESLAPSSEFSRAESLAPSSEIRCAVSALAGCFVRECRTQLRLVGSCAARGGKPASAERRDPRPRKPRSESRV